MPKILPGILSCVIALWFIFIQQQSCAYILPIKTFSNFFAPTSLLSLSLEKHFFTAVLKLVQKRSYFSGKGAKSIYKTVQCWFKDGEYDKDNRYKVKLPVMLKLAQKLEFATKMNITGQFSSVPYQTTNYGLGGLCEDHLGMEPFTNGVTYTQPDYNYYQIDQWTVQPTACVHFFVQLDNNPAKCLVFLFGGNLDQLPYFYGFVYRSDIQ